MRQTRTEQIGARTAGRITRTSIANKDPDFDYCFKTRAEVENGLVGQEGWEIVRGGADRETWHNPFAKKFEAKTKGKNQFLLGDTILCKRSKEASAYFREHNDFEKRRAQNRLLKEATKNTRNQFRKIDSGSKVTGSVTFTQRTGPNMEADSGES